MRISGRRLKRGVAFCIAVIVAMPLAETAAASPQQTVGSEQQQTVPSVQKQPQNIGNSGQTVDTSTSQSDGPPLNSVPPGQSQTNAQGGQSTVVQVVPEQSQGDAQKPVGSAAAPYEKVTD